MSYTPVEIEEFGGLRLGMDPGGPGVFATDMLNVEPDLDRGGLVTRGGFLGAFNPAVTSGTLAFLNALTGYHVIGGNFAGAQGIKAYSTAGTLLTSATSPIQGRFRSAQYGYPGGTYLYMATGSETLWRFDGSAFSKPAGAPQARYVIVSPTGDNRLVVANTSESVHRVRFSDTGNVTATNYAEVWPTNNFVDLTPGDGTLGITGMANYNNQLFVFKANRFFVFYGTSTDATGQPIFNYRVVDSNVGAGQDLVVAGREGVYFSDGRAVWLTTGGAPQRVSTAVDAYFSGDATLSLGAFSVINGLEYQSGRLYVRVGLSGGQARTLVYEPRNQEWYAHDLSLDAMSQPGPTFGYMLVSGQVGSLSSTQSPGASSYTSSYTDLGSPSQVKVVREAILVGAGTVSLGLASDFAANTGNAGMSLQSLATGAVLSSAGALGYARNRTAGRGRAFALGLSAASGRWRVNSVTLHLRDSRTPR